ncbi:MAG: FkbM family methyltransferase [Planctomycetota bacterium]
MSAVERVKTWVGGLGLGPWLSYPRRLAVAQRGTMCLRIGEVEAELSVPTPGHVLRVERLLHERAFVGRLLGAVRAGDVVFDVGANLGALTTLLGVRAAAVGASVVGFEPHPELAQEARRLIEASGGGRARLAEMALGDRDGQIGLRMGGEELSGRNAIATDAAVGEVTVAMHRADTAGTMFGEPAVVKIDVEGAEGRVLAGMSGLLSAGKVREVLIEWHPPAMPAYGDSVAGCRAWLASRGYRSVWSRERGAERHEHFVLEPAGLSAE